MPADIRGSGTQATGSAVSNTFVIATTALPYSSLGGSNNVTLTFNGMASVAGATVTGKTYSSTLTIGSGKKGRIESLIDIGAQVVALNGTYDFVPHFRAWGVEYNLFSTYPFLVLPFIWQAKTGTTWSTGADAVTSSIPFEIGTWVNQTENGLQLGPVQSSRPFYDNATLRHHVKFQLDVTQLANLFSKGYAKLEMEDRTTGQPDFRIGIAVFSDQPQTITYVGSEVVLVRSRNRKPNWSA